MGKVLIMSLSTRIFFIYGARSDCGMKVDLYSLCEKLTRAASDYYHSNKELFDFFQYQLIQ